MTIRSRFLHVALPAIAALYAAVACSTDRASVLEPIGEVAYSIQLAVANPTNVPAGSAVFSSPHTLGDTAAVDSTLRLTITTGLEPLATGVYQVFLVDTTAGGADAPVYTPATGNLRVITGTDTVRTTGVSSFNTVTGTSRVILDLTQTSAGVDPFTAEAVLVSVEAAAGATTPSTVRPLWARRSEGATTFTVVSGDTTTRIVTSAVRFGNFAPRPANEYRFVATGRGFAAVHGSVLIVEDSSLSRPPIGYYYDAVVIKPAVPASDTTPAVAGDTLLLGPQTAPFPDRAVSLRDADVNDNLHPVVQETPRIIVAASSRVETDTIAELSGERFPFRGFTTVRVTLKNKAANPNVASPVIILSATLPDIVSEGPDEP